MIPEIDPQADYPGGIVGGLFALAALLYILSLIMWGGRPRGDS
jgi:hypothetical protein